MDRVEYKMLDYSKSYLQNNNFKYCRYLSDFGDDVYTYKFPLIVYKKTNIVECEIAVSTMTGVININVYNTGTRELYAPYYDREFGHYEIIKAIDIKIKNKLKELGIKQV